MLVDSTYLPSLVNGKQMVAPLVISIHINYGLALLEKYNSKQTLPALQKTSPES